MRPSLPACRTPRVLQFRFELELTVSYFLLQFDVDGLAQLHELVDAERIQM